MPRTLLASAAFAALEGLNPPAEAQEPQAGGTLPILGTADIGHFDPTSAALVTSSNLLRAVSRQLISYTPYHRAAIQLIAWWERERGASPLTKYAGDDAGRRAPSAPVAFLAKELAALGGETGEQLMIDIAYRCWHVHKSNAPSRSNSVPD